MGTNFTRIFGDFFKGPEMRVLMLGLNHAGKTTILYKLKLGQVVNCIPTIGFNVETVEHNKFKMTIWDVGGQDKIRMLWRHYFANTNGLIYVVDASCQQRIETAKEQFLKVIYDDEMKNVPILVFANKQDIATISIPQMVDHLKLNTLKNKQWFVQGVCAKTGEGLLEGLTWLCNVHRQNLKQNMKKVAH